MMVWAVIVGMGLLVFLNRYLFLDPRLPVRLSSNARQFLGFAVPGMLTAICGPIAKLLATGRPRPVAPSPSTMMLLIWWRTCRKICVMPSSTRPCMDCGTHGGRSR